MPKIREYLYEEKTHAGKLRYRFQRERGARKIGIKGQPGEVQFERRYRELLNGADKQVAIIARRKERNARYDEGTWADLVDQFLRHMDHEVSAQGYAIGTRETYSRILKNTVTAFGEAGAANISRVDINQILANLAPTSASHNNMLKALRAVFSFALEYTHQITEDPTQNVKYKPIKGTGHKEWRPKHISQYFRHHKAGTMAHLALALLLYTACRRSDLVKLGPENLRDIDGNWYIEFRQAKLDGDERAHVSIPAGQDLIDLLKKTKTGDETFLITAYGKPYSAKGFGNRMKKWITEAGLPDDISAHGVRKTVGTLMAEAGCSNYQIMAVHGHSSPKASEIYTRGARRRVLASEGLHHVGLGQYLS